MIIVREHMRRVRTYCVPGSWRSLVTRAVSQTHTGACQTNLICKRVHHMAREQLEEKDADAIDIFPLGEITCVGRFSGLILPAHSDFKVCYLSLRSSGNCLHLPVFPAKIPNQETLTRISLISGADSWFSLRNLGSQSNN